MAGARGGGFWARLTGQALSANRLFGALDGVATERLVLRRAGPGDGPALAATIDDVVIRNNGWGPSDKDRVVRDVGRSPYADGTYRGLITDRSTGRVLGSLDFVQMTPNRRACHLGWWVGPQSRGRGIATEAVTSALLALHGVGVLAVLVGTATDNVAIQRIMARVGARQVQSTPIQLPNGTTVDSLWYVHESAAQAPP